MSEPAEPKLDPVALREALRAFVREREGQFAPTELAAALSACADEVLDGLSARAPAQGQPEENGPDEGKSGQGEPSVVSYGLSGLSDAAIPAEQQTQAGRHYVLLRAEDPRTVAILLHQTLEVGAIVLKLGEAPALNELIHVELKLVDAQFSVRTQGRVVHTSPVGTAVEVAGIGREDRAALAAILEDHRAEVEAIRVAAASARAPIPDDRQAVAAQLDDAQPAERPMMSRAASFENRAPRPSTTTPRPIPALSSESEESGQSRRDAGEKVTRGQTAQGRVSKGPLSYDSASGRTPGQPVAGAHQAMLPDGGALGGQASSESVPQPVADIFSSQRRPSSSVTLGALNRLRTVDDFSARREVELIDPDLRVLTSSGRIPMPSWTEVYEDELAHELSAPPGAQLDLHDTSTTFGREAVWVEPVAEPARVEQLEGERIMDVLLQLSGSGFTGLLQVDDDETELARQVYFDGGLVVEMVRRPRISGEELGPMLHMADRIDAQQLAMAAAHSDENHTIFERSLLELELLDQAQIRQAIAGRLTYLLRVLCQADCGVVKVYDSDAMPAGYLPAPPLRVHVPVERIIYRRLFEQLKGLDANQRQALVHDFLDTYPQITPDGYERLERVVLSTAHTRLVDQILRDRRRLREVFTESSLSPSETASVIHALYRMGVLKFDTSLHKTIVRERFRENVTVKYLSVHKASYFEVLNVHWSSYDEVIEKAYRELAVQFDPARVPDSMEAEVVQRVREIHERVEAAYRALKRHEDRSLYRQRIMPDYKLAHAIPLFSKQAELAERREDWADAADSLRRLLEINPENQQAAVRLVEIEKRRKGDPMGDPAESHF